MKSATQFIKIFMNLFTNISTLDVSEPLMATLEIVEKTLCSIKKNSEINVENKEFEKVVNGILEVLVSFRDQIVKKQTMFNQEQWSKTPMVNQNAETIIKNEVCIKVFFYVDLNGLLIMCCLSVSNLWLISFFYKNMTIYVFV